MSEQAVEVSPPAPRRAGGNPLTRKYGPLPGWGWMAAAAGVAVVYIWWRNRSASAATTSAATTSTSGAGATDYAPQIATLQAEIQQLQQGEGGGEGGRHGKERYLRHVSTGRQTLRQIARAQGETPQRIYRISKEAPESPGNLAKLRKWEQNPAKRRKNVVYYTERRA